MGPVKELMLHEFITANRDEIIARTRTQVGTRPWPSVTADELERGVPRFLTQLSETLRLESTGAPFPSGAIGATAARHGGELFGAGLNVSQVVHDYGDICQAITGLAVDRNAPITVGEFQTLNRTLDVAIAEAVTEHARVAAQGKTATVKQPGHARPPAPADTSAEEIERVGRTAHELRDILHSAILAFHMLKRGTVAINGNTGAVLGRSLMSLRQIVDRTLFEVRLTGTKLRLERLSVAKLLDDVAAAGVLDSEYRGLQFTVQPVDPDLVVDGDAQLLSTAVMNLLNNAFKYTRAGSHVVLRAMARQRRLVVEIEDECGGIPAGTGDLFESFGDRRGSDQSGLGLGLSMARKAIRAHQGDIQIRNMPGKGCVFVIEMPLAAEAGAEHAAIVTKTV